MLFLEHFNFNIVYKEHGFTFLNFYIRHILKRFKMNLIQTILEFVHDQKVIMFQRKFSIKLNNDLNINHKLLNLLYYIQLIIIER